MVLFRTRAALHKPASFMKHKMFSLQRLCKTIVLLGLCLNAEYVSTRKVKRTLLYPTPKSKTQIIFGLGLPVVLKDTSVTMGYAMKASFRLPTNVSDYAEPDIILQRRKRDDTARWHMYKILSLFLARFGGKSCILKSICEFVHLPLDKDFSVFEEILHLFFRPSITNDILIDPMDREYLAAENIGKSAGDVCRTIYSNCDLDLIDVITKIM